MNTTNIEHQVKKESNIIKYKLLYTVCILLIYLLGREIPLYKIDLVAYTGKIISAEELLMQSVGGDTYRYSLFALGISPYMIASILMQVYVAVKRAGTKERISPRKMNMMTMFLTLVLAMMQAYLHSQELMYRILGDNLTFVRAVAMIEMVTGVMVIAWLSDRNKRYGLGGQTVLIYVNIIDGIIGTLRGHSFRELMLPIFISAGLILVVLFMENTEFRITLQRISIHNIYADKNYLAIKMNPIGMMPVMFSTAFFSVPRLLTYGVSILFPDNAKVVWLKENMTLTKPVGIGVYLLIIYILTIGFSMIFINPRDLTEQFLKSGDCLVGIHAGKETRRYLSRKLRGISFISATVMCVCLGLPLMLQYKGDLTGNLVMIPSTVMLLTGMWSTINQEYQAVKSFDSYHEFI